jgi:predicted dehydrogenase
VRLALVGCGNIARRYARGIVAAERLALAGATDIVPRRAEAVVAEFGGTAYPSLEALLADDDVGAVVNLTAPQAHASVTTAALNAGKHVHSEKPLALRHDEAQDLVELAARRGLCLSCSPATLLGEAQQTAWKLVREGAIGTVRAVYAEANWGRIETWHPLPLSLYAVGPLVDVGVYPLTLVTAMLGPVRRVHAYGRVLAPERTTLGGEPFRIETPDFVVAVLELAGGAVVRVTASFYVGSDSKQRGMELHGDGGSLYLASWGDFDSGLELAAGGKRYAPVPLVRNPYRGIDWSRALVELDEAVAERRVPRTSGEHAAHIVDVLCASDESLRSDRSVTLHSDFPQPAPLEWAR